MTFFLTIFFSFFFVCFKFNGDFYNSYNIQFPSILILFFLLRLFAVFCNIFSVFLDLTMKIHSLLILIFFVLSIVHHVLYYFQRLSKFASIMTIKNSYNIKV